MAKNFSIKINGLDELIRNANKVGGDFPNRMRNAMTQSTTLIQNEARRTGQGRFKNQTGTLRRSIQKRVDGAERGVVFTDEKYAPYVEFGTRPHTITPKTGKMLAFKVGGKMVFARKVNHPGSKPYPYMTPAFEESTPKVQDIYAKLGAEVVKELAK